MQHHNYSLSELEGMIPWERQIYVALLKQYIEDANLKQKQKVRPNCKNSKVQNHVNQPYHL